MTEQDAGAWADQDELLLQAVARGWRHPTTSDREMDAVLALAIANEVKPLLIAAHNAQQDAAGAALREALEAIHSQQGRVCEEFELCRHVACQSSYSAWAIADAALRAAPAPDAGAEPGYEELVEIDDDGNVVPLARLAAEAPPCPTCGSTRIGAGPRGGDAQNVRCENGHEWNVTPFGWKRLAEAPPEQRPAPAEAQE